LISHNHHSGFQTVEETDLSRRFFEVRSQSMKLCSPLKPEDYVVQPVVDVSPPKWHLGHTTWFFETFVLKEYMEGYREYNPDYGFMFNSYYESVGDRVLRPNRGNMSRPGVKEVIQYRKHVDENFERFFSNNELTDRQKYIIEIGLQHEQQHQELLVTDIKYILGNNPLFPKYVDEWQTNGVEKGELSDNYIEISAGLYTIGHQGEGFCYDNELGVHQVHLHNFRFQDRLVTVGEYLEFMLDGGYEDFRHWFSDAWDWINANEINSPLYWFKKGGEWFYYTLAGFQKLNLYEPITHVSFYEADAYARWRGKRLLTEFEWEVACKTLCEKIPEEANFASSDKYHPQPKTVDSKQFYGEVWEWTNSAYLPYPFFEKEEGALGEYNGKFMVNQIVLRGGSCATPKDHIRPTYRNFFHPHLRWQFSGMRLAEHF